MNNLPIGKLTAGAMELANFSQAVLFSLQREGAGLILWDDITGVDGVARIRRAIEDVMSVAQLLNMPVVLHYATHLDAMFKALARVEADEATILDSIVASRLQSMITAMTTALRAESAARVAVVLPMDKIGYYEPKEPMFGALVADKFKSATYDINEAGKCLALGRSTAAVFHLMHVVEIALRAVHACLGLKPPNNPSWGIWLKDIRVDRVKRGDRKWPQNDYFQDVYSRLDAIKDAQRDPTMHVQTIHTEEEAALIFENTKALMQKIASRMDENGDPKA